MPTGENHKVQRVLDLLADIPGDIVAYADTVGKIAAQARAKKLILTHFRQKPEALMQALEADVARDDTGLVVLGRDLIESQVSLGRSI